MKFCIKDFCSKYNQICRKLRIWSHLLKKSLMENFIFCAVGPSQTFKIKIFLRLVVNHGFKPLHARCLWESWLHGCSTAQKWSFPLKISSVNVTKPAGNCVFGHIYWRNPLRKTSFSLQFSGGLSSCIETCLHA